MSDIVKGALGGAWQLVVGWFLPCSIAIGLFGIFVLPSLTDVPGFSNIANATATDKAVALLVASIVLGLVLSALQTPLYRILEGYLLWPSDFVSRRIEKHQSRRAKLKSLIDDDADIGLSSAITLEKYLRYPDSDEQVAATLLGNSIRRFEYYGQDRFKLDSQRLWYQLRSAIPDALAKEVDTARAGVDFFVCLLYTLCLLAVSGLAAIAVDSDALPRLASVVVLAAIGAVVCYRSAIVATDAWAAAVRATVDIGRGSLAKSLGLRLPETLEEERTMWEAVCWLLTFPYSPEAAKYVDPFRAKDEEDTDHEK